MRRCPTCKLRKPDAVFLNRKREEVKSYRGKCVNCRSTVRGGGRLRPKSGMLVRDFQVDEIEINAKDAKLVALAKREMKKFKKRGSPKIERPYAFIAGNPSKGMAGRRTYQK